MITPNTLAIIQRDTPSLFDPAENFVEASKLHRHLIEAEVPGIRELSRSPALLEATGRATKPYPQRRPIQLPAPADLPGYGESSFAQLLRQRRSPRAYVPSEPLTLQQLSWLCWAADGDTGEIAPGRRGRTAPSGGALYPRDLYLSTIAGPLEAGLYHFNPYRHQLEFVNSTTPEEITAASAQPKDLKPCSTVVMLSASFWRNRMKYDQRGVRFALMELGQVAQNALLAATALGLSALPLGGFFDDEVNSLVDIDGVHEAIAYTILLGRAAPHGNRHADEAV